MQDTLVGRRLIKKAKKENKHPTSISEVLYYEQAMQDSFQLYGDAYVQLDHSVHVYEDMDAEK
ncbi:hypothetical protein Scep_001550 [Stephania cephalantha]|uniref:Uncharacterized protein n=1 Tax=Stephania cephalantha TaxID=152367 RepID=A0AAP0Q555_9MAGN